MIIVKTPGHLSRVRTADRRMNPDGGGVCWFDERDICIIGVNHKVCHGDKKFGEKEDSVAWYEP